MIIDRGLMLQLCLMDDFKRQVPQWDGSTVNTKEPIVLLGKSYLTSCNMRVMVMHTEEPASTKEATERLLKTPISTYANTDLKHVSNNANQINDEERTQLLRLLEDFEDLFDDNLGDWDTEPVGLDLKPGANMFNSKY